LGTHPELLLLLIFLIFPSITAGKFQVEMATVVGRGFNPRSDCELLMRRRLKHDWIIFALVRHLAGAGRNSPSTAAALAPVEIPSVPHPNRSLPNGTRPPAPEQDFL